MKVSIERKLDKLLKVPIHVLSVGTSKYHYEKLEDVLLRVAMVFEPHQQEKEKKPKTKFPKSKRFPLGDAILEALPNIDPGISMGVVMENVKTPKPYRKSIWAAVIAKLVKKELVRMNHHKGEKVYRRVKPHA